MIQIIDIIGNAFERGIQSGKLLKKAIKGIEAEALTKLHDNLTFHDFKIVLDKIRAFSPEYYKELEGKALGAGIAFEVLAMMHCQQFMGKKSGCTTILRKNKDSSVYLSHNEDDDYSIENCYLARVHIDSSDEWFSGLDYYCNLWSGAFNWNSHGLFMTINFCSNRVINRQGIPRTFLWRHIAQAKSLLDLAERCKIPDRIGGYHVTGVDLKTSEAISVEVSPTRLSVKKVSEYAVHTNHYLHDECIPEGVDNVNEDSQFRLDKSMELLRKMTQPTLFDIRSILQYRRNGFYDSIMVLPQDLQGKTTSFNVSLEASVPCAWITNYLEGKTVYCHYL